MYENQVSFRDIVKEVVRKNRELFKAFNIKRKGTVYKGCAAKTYYGGEINPVGITLCNVLSGLFKNDVESLIEKLGTEDLSKVSIIMNIYEDGEYDVFEKIYLGVSNEIEFDMGFFVLKDIKDEKAERVYKKEIDSIIKGKFEGDYKLEQTDQGTSFRLYVKPT